MVESKAGVLTRAGPDCKDSTMGILTGTMAIVLKLMARADSIDEAQAQALAMWEARDKSNPGLAA